MLGSVRFVNYHNLFYKLISQSIFQVLLQELRVKENNYRILRRRVVWLLGRWIGVKLSVELRPLIYETVCYFHYFACQFAILGDLYFQVIQWMFLWDKVIWKNLTNTHVI